MTGWDWADKKAREWLATSCYTGRAKSLTELDRQTRSSLAALLREVGKEQWIKGSTADKTALLAGVRSVVEESTRDCRLALISPEETAAANALRALILARLDKL